MLNWNAGSGTVLIPGASVLDSNNRHGRIRVGVVMGNDGV
jgi:hypothetical protein